MTSNITNPVQWPPYSIIDSIQDAADIYRAHDGTVLMPLNKTASDDQDNWHTYNPTPFLQGNGWDSPQLWDDPKIWQDNGCGTPEGIFSDPIIFHNCLTLTHLRKLADAQLLSTDVIENLEADYNVLVLANDTLVAAKVTAACISGFIGWCGLDPDCSSRSASLKADCNMLMDDIHQDKGISPENDSLPRCISSFCRTVDTSANTDVNGIGVSISLSLIGCFR